ncbi:MAG: hypothetical protein ABI650_09355 [Dokdonella sp.]
MLSLPRIVLASLFAFAAASAAAAQRSDEPADASRSDRVSAARKAQSLLLQRDVPTSATATTASGAKDGVPIANPVRAYPPSCLSDPLPTTPTGPVYRNANVDLAASDGSGNFLRETVTITIWRVTCSSAQFFNSATLMRIQRDPDFEGDADIFPLFPAINVAQGTIGFDSPNLSLIRTATEPNTVIADTPVDTPVVFSTTYVLENYPYTGAGEFDFNLPFSIRFDNQFNSDRFYFINNVPLYNPTPATYPEAFLSVPISGYFSTNWYDPAYSGEGLVFQVFESVGDTTSLTILVSWFTYDSSGVPYWLAGSTSVARGSRVATLPVAYFSDGSFGGTGPTGSADQSPWGTLRVEFPNCNRIGFTYTANPGLPAGVPSGTGTRSWFRLANVNGLPCE